MTESEMNILIEVVSVLQPAYNATLIVEDDALVSNSSVIAQKVAYNAWQCCVLFQFGTDIVRFIAEAIQWTAGQSETAERPSK